MANIGQNCKSHGKQILRNYPKLEKSRYIRELSLIWDPKFDLRPEKINGTTGKITLKFAISKNNGVKTGSFLGFDNLIVQWLIV